MSLQRVVMFSGGIGSWATAKRVAAQHGTADLTLLFTDTVSRAHAFGAISAMGGVGAAAGPLIGGLITSAISWRAAFV